MASLRLPPRHPFSPCQQQSKAGGKHQNPRELPAHFQSLQNPAGEKQGANLVGAGMRLRCSGFSQTSLRVSVAADLKERLKSRQLTVAFAPLTFTLALPCSAQMCRQKVLNLPAAVPSGNPDCNPKGAMLTSTPTLQLAAAPALAAVQACPELIPTCCLCWAGAHFASLGSQQSTLPLPTLQ